MVKHAEKARPGALVASGAAHATGFAESAPVNATRPRADFLLRNHSAKRHATGDAQTETELTNSRSGDIARGQKKRWSKFPIQLASRVRNNVAFGLALHNFSISSGISACEDS